ncbi:excinuclease ABC subunit UvrA [Chlamydiota bacterium]
MSKNAIIVRGACEHNLKNIHLSIPRNNITIITGLSGSGKSSLAFDTLYAEGQRRYVESLSAYARQFLGQMQKPEIESIEGLPPAISIEQRSAGSNPRSTVATTTEIHDYLRLLFARVGIPHCPHCGKQISVQTVQEIVDKALELPSETRIQVLSPIIRGKKGEHKQIFEQIKSDGFIRVRINGKLYDLSEKILIDKNKKNTIEIVVDRLVVKQENKERLADSIEIALHHGDGIVILSCLDPEKKDIFFSEQNACISCGVSYGELAPRMFSFNSPYGACQECHGLGIKMCVDPELVITKPHLSIRRGALSNWKWGGRRYILWLRKILDSLSYEFNIDLKTPFNDLPDKHKDIILYGTRGKEIEITFWMRGKSHTIYKEFEGVIPSLERRFRETESSFAKRKIEKFMIERSCQSCHGTRLKPESNAVKIMNKSISDILEFSTINAHLFFTTLKLKPIQEQIAHEIIKEIKRRLQFLLDVGLTYLTLDRKSSTLSGGEAQRIRLATQIGSGLVGVLYILDEPSIGLHQRDNKKLLQTLQQLRNMGNTLIIVEHDEDTIRNADYIIDLGPGAGIHGGKVVAQGNFQDIINSKTSITGAYLSGNKAITIPQTRKQKNKKRALTIKGARQNNLKNITVSIPLGLFTCITGVSGSGKSTLIDEILRKKLEHHFYKSRVVPGEHDKIIGIDFVDKIIVIDQSPIGRTPRSNPATYTTMFSHIRSLFAQLPEAKSRGYKPGRFSFNVKGGRCEACKGDGIIKIEMHFLPDIFVECEICKGRRFNRETLEIKYKGKSIAAVLESTVEEALIHFKNIPIIKNHLETLKNVGLEYITLGQSATTLSGGEAQRVKLASELRKKATGKTVYLLDEPTTGLHFDDIKKLLTVLLKLREKGNTVVIIEHNLDVIKVADHIIDLGPEGGEKGGAIVAEGTPEAVSENQNSYTGQFLKKVLKNRTS